MIGHLRRVGRQIQGMARELRWAWRDLKEVRAELNRLSEVERRVVMKSRGSDRTYELFAERERRVSGLG